MKVWEVEIPKNGGGMRMIGIINVGERIDKKVVELQLLTRMESIFQDD